MKRQKILNISNVKYTGFLYNLELESNTDKDDLFWIEYNSRLVSHNCFPKDLKSFINFGKKINLNMTMFEAADNVNERVREKKDWLEIKGATSNNNYGPSLPNNGFYTDEERELEVGVTHTICNGFVKDVKNE